MQKQEYEVHLTANILDLIVYEKFKMNCRQLDAKSLEIILARGEHPQQIMFSKTAYTTSLAAILQDSEIWINLFEQNNIPIIRTKIEIPFHGNTMMSDVYYYEWHGLIEFKQSDLELDNLCKLHQVHLSHNALKQHENYRFLTLREYQSRSNFVVRLALLKHELFSQNRKLIKERAECCIYDTNITLDRGWLTAK